MRKLLLLLALIGLVGLVPAATAAPPPDCETIAVDTYSIATSGIRGSYRPGDTFEAKLVVTRKGTETPEGDATVAIALRRKDTLFAFWGDSVTMTDATGTAIVRHKLDDIEPGRYDFIAYAFKDVDAFCVSIHEYGADYARRGVRIRP